MFSPKEVENYQQVKISENLKNQILKNVEKKHKRNQKLAVRFAAATACLALTIFGINMYLLKNHVLSIESVPVLYSSRTIDEATPLSLANVKQEQALLLCIPLEIRTYEETEITVSDGTVTTNAPKDVDIKNQVSTIHIKKSDDILWCILYEDADHARCNIVINGKEYEYELLYEEKNNKYSIRQIKNK